MSFADPSPASARSSRTRRFSSRVSRSPSRRSRVSAEFTPQRYGQIPDPPHHLLPRLDHHRRGRRPIPVRMPPRPDCPGQPDITPGPENRLDPQIPVHARPFPNAVPAGEVGAQTIEERDQITLAQHSQRHSMQGRAQPGPPDLDTYLNRSIVPRIDPIPQPNPRPPPGVPKDTPTSWPQSQSLTAYPLNPHGDHANPLSDKRFPIHSRGCDHLPRLGNLSCECAGRPLSSQNAYSRRAVSSPLSRYRE